MAKQNENPPSENDLRAADLASLASAWLTAWEAEISAQALAAHPSPGDVAATPKRASKP